MSSESTPSGLAALSAAVRGTVGSDGQGNGTCPICGKPKFRYSLGEDGLIVLTCHSGECGSQEDGAVWATEAAQRLVTAGVPQKYLRALAHKSAPQARSTGSHAVPAPDLPMTADLLAAEDALFDAPALRCLLHDRVGLKDSDVVEAGLGWDEQSERFWLPVKDERGDVLTIIRRDFRAVMPAGGVKSMIWPGSKGAFMYAPFGVRRDEPVVIAAGERDCLALGALGMNAVCFTNGEGAVPTPERMTRLLGTHVVFIYDNDAGNHSKKVASALLPHVASARIVNWPGAVPDGYDVSDVLGDERLGLTTVEKVLADAQPWAVADAQEERERALYDKEMTRLRVAHRAKLDFAAELAEQRHAQSNRSRFMHGETFFLDLPSEPPVLWGSGHDILWVDGEPLLVCGDDGTGKSTLDHQLIACRLGVREALLGYEVEPATGRVVYLAMDRPEQARRAGARLFPKDFRDEYRALLRDRLAVWSGPLPVDVLRSPEVLADWIQRQFGNDVSDVHVDSLKDIAARLSDDAVGSGINSAIQEVVARGINVVSLHHQRKANGENRSPTALSDVYGSRWLTAGQGSVVMLVRPGDDDKDTIELRQLKEPMDRVPAMLARHDRVNGRTHVISEAKEPEQVLRDYGDTGATASQVAAGIYGKPVKEISDAERKKAERRLRALIKQEQVRKIDGNKGGSGGSTGARYVLLGED